MSKVYLVLTALAVLISWVANIYGLTLPDGSLMPSMLSSESVRWMVRHSVVNVAAAPLAETLLLLLLVGAMHSSGLWYAWHHVKNLEQRRRHAMIVASAVMTLLMGCTLMGILPGGNLLSVTGRLTGSPFAQGWLALVTLVGVIPAIIYGKMCETWSSKDELNKGLASAIAVAASCFVDLVVAAQLVAVVQHIQLLSLIGLSPTMQRLGIGMVYAAPIIQLFIKKRNTYDTPAT